MLHQPSEAEILMINLQREAITQTMSVDSNQLLVLAGPCAAESDRLSSGELATEAHVTRLADVAQNLAGLHVVGRLVGNKPRTATGDTGLLHRNDGPEVYTAMAGRLTRAGVPLAAEILGEVDIVATPWLSVGWTGARNAQDTGVRYLARQSSRDLDKGFKPLPVFVKNGTDGNLDAACNAIETIQSPKPATRTQMTIDGLHSVRTFGNPHVGMILRGGALIDSKDPADRLVHEIGEAREALNKHFDNVPIIVDLSHGNAKRFGGGEQGQLACAEAVANILLDREIALTGVMAETNVLAGNQPADGAVAGLSRTDPCIGEAAAIKLLHNLNEAHQPLSSYYITA